MPPKRRGKGKERLERLKWIHDHVATSRRAVRVYDLEGIVAHKWDVSARQVRDDLMIFRRPTTAHSLNPFVFWKTAGREYIWTHTARYNAATRPRDGSLEAYE